MGRIRTIKPEFWRNEGLSALPEATHLLAAALLNYADDEGYFNANVNLIKAECCPLREPSVSLPRSLTELSLNGYVTLGGTSDGRRYGKINKFPDHQRVSHPTASKIKGLEITWDDSAHPHGSLTEDSVKPPEIFRPEQGTGNRERNRERGKEQGSALVERETVPEGLDLAAWERWVEYRSKLKKPIKPVSVEEAQKELARYGPQQNEVVARSMAHGWQGLFPLDSRANGGQSGRKPERNSPAERAADAAIERQRQRARRSGGGPTGVP